VRLWLSISSDHRTAPVVTPSEPFGGQAVAVRGKQIHCCFNPGVLKEMVKPLMRHPQCSQPERQPRPSVVPIKALVDHANVYVDDEVR